MNLTSYLFREGSLSDVLHDVEAQAMKEVAGLPPKDLERHGVPELAESVLARIDGFLFEWKDGLAADITSRLAADFTGWEVDEGKYEDQLSRLLAALRTDPS